MPNPRKNPRKSPAEFPDDGERHATKVFPGEAVTVPRPITLFDNMGPEDQVRVYREDERTHKMVFHGVIAKEESTEDHVYELFGGGKYRGQLMKRDEAGRFVVDKSCDFLLPGTYKPVSGDLPGTIRTPPVVGTVGTLPQPAAVTSGTRELMESAMFSKVMEMMQRPQPSIDWPPIVASMATLAGTVITGLMTRKTGPDPETRAALDRMETILASIKGQPGPATTAIGDAVKAIKELVEVRDVIQGGAVGDGGEKMQMWSMGAKLLEALAGQRGPMAQPAPVPGQPMIEAGTSPLPLWHQWLLHYADQLTAAARRGMDAEYLAEMVTNLLPQDEEGILVEFLAKVNAEQLAYDVVPVLREFPTWTAALVTALRKEMAPDSADGEANDVE